MIGAVTHLIDDQSFGGINRMLDYMKSNKELGAVMHHSVKDIKRGQMKEPELQADVIVSHLSISWANMPMLTALRAAYPDTPILHVEHSYSQRFTAGLVENRERFDALLAAAYSLFDGVVAVSRAQAQWLERRGHCPAEKLHCIRSGVDLAPYFNIEPRKRGNRFIIGAVGRFHVQKGFDLLIKAFVQAGRDDIELRLYGDGPDREHLIYSAAQNPNITFTGYMPDTSKAIEEVDAIAMPSRWEPYGLVALEAMAAGRAVLTTRVDGLNDHIRAGAIDIGENTVRGWTDFLNVCDVSLIGDRGEPCRTAAKLAQRDFINKWNDLLVNVTSGNLAVASAA